MCMFPKDSSDIFVSCIFFSWHENAKEKRSCKVLVAYIDGSE